MLMGRQCQVCKTFGWTVNELVGLRVGPFTVRICSVCYNGLLRNPSEYEKLVERFRAK